MPEAEAVEEVDENEVRGEKDEGCLEEVEVLVVAELAKHVVAVVQELAAYGESIPHPEAGADLRDKSQDCTP